MEGLVEHAAEGGCFVLLDEVADGGGVEQGLHELAGLSEVEELAVADGVAHLEDAFLLVPVGVGCGADGDIHLGLFAGEDGGDDALGEAGEFGGCVLVTLGAGVGFGARGGGGLLGGLLGGFGGRRGFFGRWFFDDLLHDFLLGGFFGHILIRSGNY